MVRNVLTKVVPASAKNVLRRIRDGWKIGGFVPSIKPLRVGQREGRFFLGTPQATEWYEPMKPYARVEYEWVLENVPLRNQSIVDGGAHHGHYSVVFALGSEGTGEIVAVDPYPMNCDLVEVNFRLNAIQGRTECCAIAREAGSVQFAEQSNGRILRHGGMRVIARTLEEIRPGATVVKLDIEGSEFDVIPSSLPRLPKVHSWVVEIHPGADRQPDTLVQLFIREGYEVHYLDRDALRVVPYVLGTHWKSHSTVFARRVG